MKAIGFAFCIFYHSVLFKALAFADDFDEVRERMKFKKLKSKYPRHNDAEVQAGDMADYFGVNKHKFVPPLYKDFARRFVLQYPYSELQGQPVNIINNIAAEASLHQAIEGLKKKNEAGEKILIPKQAPPEVVLAIAKQSARLQAMKPINHVSELLEKENLRTGKYWNDVWVEEVRNPDNLLRSQDQKLRADVNDVNFRPKLNVIRVRVMPGSKLHDLVSQAKKISPRLLYVMNNKRE